MGFCPSGLLSYTPIGYLVMAEDRKSLKFRQSMGNNSAITDDTPIKLHIHKLTMVIYIQYKFDKIPSIGYLVMAEDGKPDEQKGNGKPISFHLWRGINNKILYITRGSK